jgi:hypothetical protein
VFRELDCERRTILERIPNDWWDGLKLKLVLRGSLPPHKRGTIDAKQRIRREIHPQLRMFWNQGIMQNAWIPPSGGDGIAPIQKIADNYARCGFRFVPLVRVGMACSLNILILRRDDPYRVFSGFGDLDGRVKTLIDALRMPQQCQEVAEQKPSEDEDPFFCLLEDDKLIFDFKVETDRLLIPPEPDEPERDVIAIIDVYVKLALGFDFAVLTNVNLYGP